MKRHSRLIVAGTLTLVIAVAAALSVRSQTGQQNLQQGFEGRDPVWLPGPFDAAYKEMTHRITDVAPHTGQKCELIQLQAEKGSYIYYTYPIGKAPVIDELNVSVYVKANRPGMQLLCRVVLPRERDPKNPGQPLTILLKGDTYGRAGRWEMLSVPHAVKLLREQQQLLTADLKRSVLIDDAYVDRVILNVYGGPGETNVYTDDLEVSPLLDGPTAGPPDTASPGKGVAVIPAVNRRGNEVSLRGSQLTVNDGERFFPRMIRHTGTPLAALRKAGFNVVFLDESTPTGLIDEAAKLGFWIVPSLAPPTVPVSTGGPVPAQLTSATTEAFGRKMAPFLNTGAVFAWDVYQNVQSENYALVSLSERPYRNYDPMRPLAIDVVDGLKKFANDPNPLMIGIHRWPLMTGLELTGYRDWLTQRRALAGPDHFCWTWIQTHLDDWYTTQVYDRPAATGFDEPVGPQAEQIRLMTYIAVGCGYRGVAFWSDRFLADSHAGRDRLLAMALLNQELQLLEPLLVTAGSPTWIDTSHPDVKAAVFRTDDRKAMLVLPVWLGNGSQFVPGQAAVSDLKITVPQVMDSAQAWEVSPGQVQSLRTTRTVGGTSVSLHEFSLTGAIVFTSDLSRDGLVVRFQNRQRSMAPDAARFAHEQAIEELAKVEKVQAELDEMGLKLVDGQQLLAKSRTFIDASAKARRDGDYAEAYANAQRALRPLRILMRAQWDRAVRELGNNPAVNVYAASFFTLPRFWKSEQEIKGMKPTENVLAEGNFELPMDRQPEGWVLDKPTPLDHVVTKAERVTTEAKVGKQSLMLEMLPKDATLPPLALERSYVAITSPAVKLPPGTEVQISVWIKIPQKIASSVDGVLFFDSAAGEPFAFRLSGPEKEWRNLTMYRRVPASGTISASMVLTGIGRVYFDDLRIEPMARPK